MLVRWRPSSWMQFSSLFLKSSMTRANNWWSNEFPDGWLPSNHSTYRVCECKHAISNTPKGKNHTLKDRESEGATARLRNGNEVPGKHVSNNGHWLVCGVRCGTILLKPHIGTVSSSSAQFWVLPIQKMTGSRGSPVPKRCTLSVLCSVCDGQGQWRTEGGCLRGFNPPPLKIWSFDKVEPDCKLSRKCLVFLFQHPN